MSEVAAGQAERAKYHDQTHRIDFWEDEITRLRAERDTARDELTKIRTSILETRETIKTNAALAQTEYDAVIRERDHERALREREHDANVGLNDAYARVVRERDEARAEAERAGRMIAAKLVDVTAERDRALALLREAREWIAEAWVSTHGPSLSLVAKNVPAAEMLARIDEVLR